MFFKVQEGGVPGRVMVRQTLFEVAGRTRPAVENRCPKEKKGESTIYLQMRHGTANTKDPQTCDETRIIHPMTSMLGGL